MLTASSKYPFNTDIERQKTLTIAIDGPAGAGKSTVAQKIANTLGYLYIDTGAMYRAATWVALERRANLDDLDEVVRLVEAAKIELKTPDESSKGRVRVFVNGSDVTMIVRSRIISKFVSAVAAIPGVRRLLVLKQQALAANFGVVMDGRDIGTVVLPDADVKVFLTASADIRAERRLKDLKELGQLADFETLKKEIETRDHADMTRQTSPLCKAVDAVEVNTDTLSINEVVEEILRLAHQKTLDSSDN